MSPATWPRGDADEQLLVVDTAQRRWQTRRVRDFPEALEPGDLVVVNDAATVPASLRGTSPTGAPVEVRLLASDADDRWRAVLFGAGNWQTPTEDRAAPPALLPGDVIVLGPGFSATIIAVSGRLVDLQLHATGGSVWEALYAYGSPVQYAYLRDNLALSHVQTPYASRPWSVEMPSAGRPLRMGVLMALRARGVEVASLTHAAGLSSTGDPELDALLPLPERYEIPEVTVRAVAGARGRVIAVGTTVVRALEGCVADNGRLVAGEGVTDLRIGPGFQPRVIDALLTGLHEPTESHFALMQAFADEPLLRSAYAGAAAAGYLIHEFGDLCLIM